MASVNCYRLKRGLHQDPMDERGNPGKVYKPGDKVYSSEDLIEKFPNKFELVGEGGVNNRPSSTGPKKHKKTKKAVRKTASQDVTSKFFIAGELGLTVAQNNDGNYEVFDGDVLLNSNLVLAKRIEVVRFLRQYQ